MTEIEKGVPIPRDGRMGTPYPFRDMEVGDSFFVAGEACKTQRYITGRALMERRRTGMKFTTRRVDGGVRVWRIA